MNQVKKQLKPLVQFVLAICCLGSVTPACQEHSRRPSLFLIPEGYVGWLRIDFGIEGAPPISLEDGYYLFKFSLTGPIRTSSKLEQGYAEDQYYYYSSDSGVRRRINGSISGGSGIIRGEMISRDQDVGDIRQYFFVGNETEFKEAGLKAKDKDGNPSVGPVKIDPSIVRDLN